MRPASARAGPVTKAPSGSRPPSARAASASSAYPAAAPTREDLHTPASNSSDPDAVAVRVAVRARPLLAKEKVEKAKECIRCALASPLAGL